MSKPILFGILNITEDSFSDGGRFLAPEKALAHASALIAGGAHVLDLGAASSNPDASSVPAAVGIARLTPLLAAARENNWTLSIDSFSTETQRWALAEGVAYLNDIQGFPEPELYPALAESAAKLVVMHAVQERGRAQRIETDPETIMEHVVSFFDRRIAALVAGGVARERLILDPGMGFFLGAKPEVSLTVLRHLTELKAAFGLPVLISVSRKGFLRKLTGTPVEGIGPATLAAELYAVLQGADMIRTHDPKALRDALTIWHCLSGPS